MLDATFAVGVRLAELVGEGSLEVRVLVDTAELRLPTHSVVADSPFGDPERVVFAGAHLDSVEQGPGINDNGSGSALTLALALAAARLEQPPANRFRVAFWGAEELGLIGSTRYVEQLAADERDRILGYLNFDMVGSPNGVREIYDGDGSLGESEPGPPGSGSIEALFETWFEDNDLSYGTAAFDGRSDYGPFIEVGIPAGGLFTGANGNKSLQEAQAYGGTPASPYDPCYHQDCDTLDNVDRERLLEMARAASGVTETMLGLDEL